MKRAMKAAAPAKAMKVMKKAAMKRAMKAAAPAKAMKAMKKAAMKRAMKAAAPAKAMKAMKKKSVSKIARGRFAKVLVFRGSKAKTVGGLTSEMLIKNKRGKVVSKRQSAAGKRRYVNIKPWVEACMAARKSLHVQGFHAVNGTSLQGKALYFKASSFFKGSAVQSD